MKYVVDTNVMLRYLLNDDDQQSAVASRMLSDNSLEFIIPTYVLNEVIWFLKYSLKVKRLELISLISDLLARDNFMLSDEEVKVGLNFLQSGGDFADGVIACQVSQYNNASLLTFDKKAQKIARALNIAVSYPS